MELIEEIYNKCLEKPRAVLNIFNEFFGEEYVDMQGFASFDAVKSHFYNTPNPSMSEVAAFIGGGFILVHFPHVTITNENNNSVDINHLWARVNILTEGQMNGKFLLNRSEYTKLHLYNSYMH